MSHILNFVGAYGAKLTFNNKCPYTVWPGTSASGQNQLSKTGFELASGESTSLNVPSPWEGQFWARTGCSSSSDKFTCTTGDCGSGQVTCHGARALPPATTAELSVAANRGNDIYAITNVNGFNVPMSIAPRGGTGECKLSSCAANINEACPVKLRVKGNDGKVVGCNSACVAFNEAKYCCTGEFESPELCKPSEYALFFKKKCPLAYSYPSDDESSTFSCSRADYTITFCP